MLDTRTLNRRQLLMATGGAALFALVQTRQAGATVDIYTVISGPLNLRSGPGTDYSVIASLKVGTTMEIIDDGGNANGYHWVKVWVSSIDTTGFVADAFIAKSTTPTGPSFPVGANAVTTSELNLRSGAGLGYGIIVTLWNGAPVTITGAPVSANGYTWYPVRTGYGTEGWVAGEYLSAGTVPGPAFAVGSTAYTTTRLNLRSGAGLSYSVIVVLWEGAPVTITGAPVAASGYTWYPVRTGYGTTGWVAGEFLTA